MASVGANSTQGKVSRPVSVAGTADHLVGTAVGAGPRPRAVTVAGGMSLPEMQQAVDTLSGRASPVGPSRVG
jgi:hypothetical protein